MFTKSINKLTSGFSLVEVLIASAIISVMIFAMISAVQSGISLSYNALKQTQAGFLLEEGAEAIKSIRDSNWSNISSLTLDTPYYLSYNNNTNLWSLSTTETPKIDSIFSRTITFSAVYRDVNDDISITGTQDPEAKEVTVNVSWVTSDNSVMSKDVTFYIFDIFN